MLCSLGWPSLDSNATKQSVMEFAHDAATPTTLLHTSLEAMRQSSDIHRTYSSLSNPESPKSSEYYYSHSVSTVYGSASMPPPSHISNPEPLSGPAVHPDIQLSQTSPNSSSTGVDSFAEPTFAPPDLQPERINISDTMSGLQEGLSNNLVSGHDLNIQNDGAIDDHQLYPSRAVFGNYHVTSSFTEPTMGPPEVFFPANTMDLDYGSGSGDYLETMSYMGSEGDDYSLVTSFPSNIYDFEESNSESYDTSFPTRIVIPLSTRYFSPSPSAAVPDRHVTRNPNLPFSVPQNSTSSLQVTSIEATISQSVITSTTPVPISSTVYVAVQAIHPTAVHSLHQSSRVSETSELYSNWPDVTIEPSDVLLPDMNSLEYYNTQLTKSNESWTEQRGNQTTSKYFSVLSVSTTSTYTVPPNPVLTATYGDGLQPMDNNSWPEESSTDLSIFELSNTTILDLSDLKPSLMNSTFPFLYSSALTSSMDFSTADWIGTELVSSAVPSSTSPPMFFPPTNSEESHVMFLTSMNTYWSVSSTLPVASLPTSSLISDTFTQTHNASAVPTEPTLSNTSALSVVEMADQGFTEVPGDGMTTASKPVVSTNLTVLSNETAETFPGPTAEVFNTTTLPTPSVTTQTSTLQTTTVRVYLCNMTKPDTYLVRVGQLIFFLLFSDSGLIRDQGNTSTCFLIKQRADTWNDALPLSYRFSTRLHRWLRQSKSQRDP